MTDDRMPPPDEPATGDAAAEDAVAPGPGEAASRAEAAAPAAPAPAAPAAPAAPSASAVPAAAGPAVEAASPDVDAAAQASPLPGAHRGGFSRLPTAPIDVTMQSAPSEPGGEYVPADWTPAADVSTQRGLAGWALGFAIIGVIVSLFVGWGFPIGLVAVVTAIVALRRPIESRAVAVWALVLGVVSILYSAGWLLYAALRADLFG